MALVITAVPSGELLSVEEGKTHLRVNSSDLDGEIALLIRDARDYCERWTNRTLRAAVTRTEKYAQWWSKEIVLPWPPLLSSPAPVITYYDSSNISQTLSSGNYYVEVSTNGSGRIVWAPAASLPNLYAREDAITLTYSTGYADATTIPPVALRAMKTKMTELWGAGTEGESEAARKCTDRLLSTVDWTGYA